MRRKYFQLSFLAVCLAGMAQINPHRNNVTQGQDLAKVSSPHFMKTGIIQSKPSLQTCERWPRARGHLTQEDNLHKQGEGGNTERKERKRGGRVEDLTVNSFFHTQKLSCHNPISLSLFLFFIKNGGNV